MKKLVVVSCVALLGVAAGCGSSDSGGGAGGSGGGSSSNAGSSSGGASGAKDANTICAGITAPHVQALFTSTVSGNTPLKIGANFECKFQLTDSKGGKNTDTHANLYVSDADEHQFGLLKTQFPDDTFYDLAGVGDKAYWFQAIDGLGVPTVVVHQGDASCTVQVADNLDNSTCKFTGTQDVSKSDATDYATEMAVLCTDLFTVDDD